jgi:hypothetical protein
MVNETDVSPFSTFTEAGTESEAEFELFRVTVTPAALAAELMTTLPDSAT